LRAKHSAQCIGFDTTVGGKNKLLAGGTWATIVFNGEAMTAIGEDDALRYAIPKEGSSIWLDTMTVSSGSRNLTGAHAFIAYILDAEAGAKLANFVQFGSPNAAARPFLTAEDLDNPVIYPNAKTLERLQYQRDPGPAQRAYDEAWTAVKSR
jgi:spermidine/putrescine transport system substrate-binding protein